MVTVRCNFRTNDWRCPVTFEPKVWSTGKVQKLCAKCLLRASKKVHNPSRIKHIEVPDGHVRCSRTLTSWQCCNTFPVEFLRGRQIKTCPPCREKANNRNARWKTFEKGHNSARASAANYRKTDTAKQIFRVAQQKYRRSDHGKAKIAAREMHPLNKLRQRMNHLLRSHEIESRSLTRHTNFPSNAALRGHLESTFEQWMNWSNYGKHKRHNPYNNTWNIGHRIPCASYNPRSDEDIRRCHSLSNIFAQDARTNNELKDSIPDKETLMHLRSVWPISWSFVNGSIVQTLTLTGTEPVEQGTDITSDDNTSSDESSGEEGETYLTHLTGRGSTGALPRRLGEDGASTSGTKRVWQAWEVDSSEDEV